MKTVRIYVKILIVISICISKYSNAQDLHFSQYFNSPLLINPANTGFAPDVDWRVGLNYRNQWASITPNPYKTMSAWGDMQLFNNRVENGCMGIGASLLKDVAGSGQDQWRPLFRGGQYAGPAGGDPGHRSADPRHHREFCLSPLLRGIYLVCPGCPDPPQQSAGPGSDTVATAALKVGQSASISQFGLCEA